MRWTSRSLHHASFDTVLDVATLLLLKMDDPALAWGLERALPGIAIPTPSAAEYLACSFTLERRGQQPTSCCTPTQSMWLHAYEGLETSRSQSLPVDETLPAQYASSLHP